MVPPEDLMGAREFYLDELGFTEVPMPSTFTNVIGFWAESGSIQIHIGVESGVDRSKTAAHNALVVDNLDQWRIKLASLGCETMVAIPIPGRRRLSFRDPFGNCLELFEYDALV